MNNVEEIFSSKKLIGIVIRGSTRVDGRNFFTESTNPLQVAVHDIKTKTDLATHTHQLKKPVKISEIQEFLYVQKGKIEVSFESGTGKKLATKVLTKTDSILIMNVAHKISFYKNTRVIEVKQGPYISQK